MSQQPPPPEVLAHWRYTPGEWQDYVAFETESSPKEVAAEFKKNGCIVAVVVLTGLAVPFCKFGASAAESLFFGGIMAAALLSLIFVALWFARQSSKPRPRPGGGEVYITAAGVRTNMTWFGWGESDPAWRLGSVRRQTFHTPSGKSIEFLVFRCWSRPDRRYMQTSDRWEEYWGRTFRDKELRVPIPRGKGAEADSIAGRLLPEEPVPESAEHDFRGGACRKCGSSQEAAEHFGWGCKGRGV